MASSTRSGRVLRHGGRNSTRAGNATAKLKNIKDSPISGSKATGTKNRVRSGAAKDTRSSSSSGTATAGSSSLKNSSSETSAKKMMASTPTPRKSERLEKKRAPSPLRRSVRIGKNAISCSPVSKKLKVCSSSPLKKEKLDGDKNEKIAITRTENQSKDNNLNTKNGGISKKKTRLHARRYRALLQPKNGEYSDDDDVDIKDDSELKGSSANSASGNSKRLNEDLDGRNGRKEDIICCEYSVNDHKQAADVSTCSRELADLTKGCDKLRKSACLSRKRKIKDKALVSQCSDNKPESYPIGLTTNNNSVAVVNKKQDADKLDVEELEASGIVASTSEARKTDICNPETSKADLTSPPCETTSRDTMRCVFCDKLERVYNVSETHGMCLCNSQRDHVLAPSVIEESCKLLSYPFESEAGATHSHGNSYEGNVKLEAREHSAGSEKKNGLVLSPIKKNITFPLNVDRGTFGVIKGMHNFEDHLRIAHTNESPVAVHTDSGSKACVICKHPGQLLCCGGKGCKQGYHLSCLCPPMQDVPLGVWLCHFCVKKKVESGVYSVSDGIESVWDVKEGTQDEKQYFVKYKDLAHVHNQWVPESQILIEAPVLAAKFDRRDQKEMATRWKQEWAQPHRLLLRRQLMPKNLTDENFLEHGDKVLYCYHEWLVKWKGLGYEHATWELETAPFLCSSDGRVLILDFENRQKEAKRRSDPSRTDKVSQVKANCFHKVTSLPNDFPAGLDNDNLNSVNRLREFWHKSQNAIFVDDQKRIIKSILFLLSLKSHTSRSILIISTIHCLPLWETEFTRLAPSFNVVVYTGTKDIRKLIRTSEFYEEGGCVMFQVLLSHPDAVIEDFDALVCIGWEALIIDECQNPRVSIRLDLFKNFSTEFRLLLLNGQLKDNVSKYWYFLSFLESGGKNNESGRLKFGAFATLKKKLIRYVANERKPGSSMFVEYWVPVQLSNVQLEQYCSALVSNLTTLRARSKVDHVGALRDILISIRKCCDHPYLVGESLQSSLFNDLPLEKYLDVGVDASGKLHLLDKFLREIKNQGLRVLILFQSVGGSRRNSIGDILDDFVRQRFGVDSYERVDGGLTISKKLAVLRKFNDKASGRFIFLIENRACLPSIRLSSVDAVLIFSSDWNPLNDLRALQKIHIESQFEHVKVFRLYSSCTVEEKALIFAKQDIILDSNCQNISRSNSHLLLSWGALHLFNELDDFHQHNTHEPSQNSSENCFLSDSTLKFLDDVMVELVKVLRGKAEIGSGQCSFLIKTQHSGASYSRNVTLVGERNGISELDKDPPTFWSDLLEKRYPIWKFICEPSQRIRKRVQHFEESSKGSGVENDETRKRQRKLTSNAVDPISLQTWLQDKTKGMFRDTKILVDISPSSVSQPASVSPTIVTTSSSSMPIEPELHKFRTSESEGRRNAQRVLHLHLMPEISEICDTLKLPDDVKHKAHDLLEYLLNNHHVNREPESILQAFKLSVCLRAAKFMNHMVDHKECLALAKKYLNYTCTREQTNSVYSKLRILKKIFSQSCALRHEGKTNSWENESSPSRKADSAQQMHRGTSVSSSSYLQHSEVKEVSDGHRSSRLVALCCEQAPVGQSPSKGHPTLCSFKDALLEKKIDLVGIICSKRLDDLALKQQEELSDFYLQKEEEEMRLKSAYDDLLELICSIHTDYTIRNEKIKLLNQDFSKKMAAFDQHMKCQRTKLAVMQEDAVNGERDIRERWLEEASTGTLVEAFETLPLTESGFRLEEFKEVIDQVEASDGSRSTMPLSMPASDRVCSDTLATLPGISAGITENDLHIPSTLFHGRLEYGKTLASCSSNMAEMESLQPIGASAEVLETVPSNIVGVESVEPAGKSSKIPRPASDIMCNDMITTVPQMSSGTIENHLDVPSFSIARVEDAENLASSSSNVPEVEAIHPNGMSAGIPDIIVQKMAEVESIEPNGASLEIPATILPAWDSNIFKDSGTSFSEPLVTTNTTHMVPLQINGRTDEIPGTVRPKMVVPESIQSGETSAEILAATFPAGADDITKDNGTPFSKLDLLSVLGNQTESNQTPAGPPATIALAGDSDLTSSGSLFSESDVINALNNQATVMHMAPSVATSLPVETETPVSQSNDMVEVEPVQPNRSSGDVPVTISSPQEGISKSETPPSQMNPTGSGPDEILVDSRVATPEVIADGDIYDGEDNGANVGSALQNLVDLHSISYASTNSYYGNSVSSAAVLPVSEHESLAVTVGTECDNSLACLQTTAPAVSFGNVSTLLTESTVQHACTMDSTLLHVPRADSLSTENGQAGTPQPLTSEGENRMHGTRSCQSMHLSMHQPIVAAEAQVEKSNQLAHQPVLHQLPPAETLGMRGLAHPEGNCSSTSLTGLPVQQLIVPTALQAEQFNHLLSQSVHPLLPSTNLLLESTHSGVIADTGVPQQPVGRLLQMLPMAACVHPQGLHPDPLQNELTRIQKQVELRTKLHEDKKLQLKSEYDEEIEKVCKKYAVLLQDEEAGFRQDKKTLETIYNKVFVNRMLAEEFRAKFIDTKGGASASFQGHSSSSMEQSLQVSHTPDARRQPSISDSAHAPNFTSPPAVAIPALSSAPPITLDRSGAQAIAGPPATSGLVVRNTTSVIHNNHVRSQLGHTLAPCPNLQGRPDMHAAASRAPAPHLHRFRPQSSSMPPILPPCPSRLLSQQQLRSSLGTATAAATVPPVPLLRPPLNGTYLPVASGQLPLSRGISPPVEFCHDLGGATDVTADLRNMPQLAVGPSVHGRAPLKSPGNGS